MGSEVVVMGELPLLPAIKTSSLRQEKPVEGGPMAEEHTLRPAVVCPPAPRKPRPAKRKVEAPPNGFHDVPCDLASIFLALPLWKKSCVDWLRLL
ncbi:hypothetical protein MUK42_19387 [Musa troglodytarum]|uniref:Uncharacterized protein n=1 Tax=Musa troglodytarum TaxID=320322 RepID=A0A9E7K1N1_9LILI|nr:hypothetical protein MUK42_19387 [Musa troglodytarum]